MNNENTSTDITIEDIPFEDVVTPAQVECDEDGWPLAAPSCDFDDEVPF